MENIIPIIILVLIIGGAALYIYKAKKRGVKCIGCPYAKSCKSRACGCQNEPSDTEAQDR